MILLAQLISFNPLTQYILSIICLLSDLLSSHKVSVVNWFKFFHLLFRWFKNRIGELKTYGDWKNLWLKNNIQSYYFTPPRDARYPLKDRNGEPIKMVTRDAEGVTKQVKLYQELSQLNLILICPKRGFVITWAIYTMMMVIIISIIVH